MFDYITTNAPTQNATKIAFVVIHYNRLACLSRCLESICSELENGDCIIFIENGSPEETQKKALKLFEDKTLDVPNGVCKVIASTLQNKTGTPAYQWALDLLCSKLLPNLQHALFLADDDLLTKDWRSSVATYLELNSWVGWGFNYINWSTNAIVAAKSHTGQCIKVKGCEVHLDWLDQISGIQKHSKLQLVDGTFPQSHSSCGVISIKSLKDSIAELDTVLPIPYGDVGLAMIIKYADKYTYIDKPLGLIGRGSNYGMGDSLTMAANHSTRGRIHGIPSHGKYLAATYLECLFVLDLVHLIPLASIPAMRYHLGSTFGSKRSPLRIFLGQLARGRIGICRAMIPDVFLAAFISLPDSLSGLKNLYILWLLGAASIFWPESMDFIQKRYLQRIREDQKRIHAVFD